MIIPTIETPRLLLRPLTRADVDRLAPITSDPEAMRYIGRGGAVTAEHTAKILDFFEHHWRENGFGVWGVVERESGELIGWCGIQYLEKPQVEVLYLLGRSAWGKGLAAEAARASIDFGFSVAGLDRIIAIAWPENHRSIRVMEKTGMRPDGSATYFGIEMTRYVIDHESPSNASPMHSSTLTRSENHS
jgi:ribosomal-protein-alanine N-acetyltransferase